MAKISSKKDCEKMENNSTLEKVLLVRNRNVKLLRLLEQLLISKCFLSEGLGRKIWSFWKVHRKKVHNFFICLLLLSFELSNINWKCSENFILLTEITYDSAVFKNFLNIITIRVFIEQQLIEIFYEILIMINGVFCDLRNKNGWTWYKGIL